MRPKRRKLNPEAAAYLTYQYAYFSNKNAMISSQKNLHQLIKKEKLLICYPKKLDLKSGDPK